MPDETSPGSSSEHENAEKRLQIVKAADASDGNVQPSASKKRTATRKAAWRAWTGTIGDLRSTNARFEELVQSRNAELERNPAEADPDTYGALIDLISRSVGRDDHLRLMPEATITTLNDDTVSGRFEDVIDELDPRTWATISLDAHDLYSRDEYLSLEFRRKPGSDGSVVELNVRSADPGMAVSSLTRLSELVELGKPKWAWFHSKLGPGLTISLALIIVIGAVAAVLNRRWPVYSGSPDVASPTLIVVAIMLGVGLPLALTDIGTRLMRRLLPPAEIRYDHIPQSTGSRLIASFVALLLIPVVLAVVLALVL